MNQLSDPTILATTPDTNTPPQPPTPPPPSKPSLTLPILLTFLITSTLFIGGFFGYQYLSKTQPPSPTPLPNQNLTTQDPTSNWTTYQDEVLNIEYKLPPKLKPADLNNKEVSGDTGTQYCLVYTGEVSFSIVKQVFAGMGSCGGSLFQISTVSDDYSAARSGGFGDLTGYELESGKYYPRFINEIREVPLPEELITEITNQNGVKILRIIGNDNDPNDENAMPGPSFGTPGKGYIGALINHSSDGYYGFNISMKTNFSSDIEIFDQILSTLKFTKSSTSSIPTGWKTYNNTTLNYSIEIPPEWTGYSMNDFSAVTYNGAEEVAYFGPIDSTHKPPQIMQISQGTYSSVNGFPPSNCTITKVVIGKDKIDANHKICEGMDPLSHGFTYIEHDGIFFVIDDLSTTNEEKALFNQILSTFKLSSQQP